MGFYLRRAWACLRWQVISPAQQDREFLEAVGAEICRRWAADLARAGAHERREIDGDRDRL